MKGFGPLFGMLADRIEALLADKGYDADAIRAELAKADVEAVVPAKSNRRTPIPHDREKYRWRKPRRAPVQQTQELASCRDPLRQDRGILPRLRRARFSYAVATLCPRGLSKGGRPPPPRTVISLQG